MSSRNVFRFILAMFSTGLSCRPVHDQTRRILRFVHQLLDAFYLYSTVCYANKVHPA